MDDDKAERDSESVLENTATTSPCEKNVNINNENGVDIENSPVKNGDDITVKKSTNEQTEGLPELENGDQHSIKVEISPAQDPSENNSNLPDSTSPSNSKNAGGDEIIESLKNSEEEISYANEQIEEANLLGLDEISEGNTDVSDILDFTDSHGVESPYPRPLSPEPNPEEQQKMIEIGLLATPQLSTSNTPRDSPAFPAEDGRDNGDTFDGDQDETLRNQSTDNTPTTTPRNLLPGDDNEEHILQEPASAQANGDNLTQNKLEGNDVVPPILSKESSSASSVPEEENLEHLPDGANSTPQGNENTQPNIPEAKPVPNTETIVNDTTNPQRSNENTPINSPRTPLSDVASDQGGSFASDSDTNEDSSLMAQELVNQVIDKAIDSVQDQPLDQSAVTEHKQGDEERPEKNVVGEIPQSLDDDGDDNQNIFLQRGQGNGDTSDNDDDVDDDEGKDQDQNHDGSRSKDDVDGNQFSHPAGHYENGNKPVYDQKSMTQRADVKDEDGESKTPLTNEGNDNENEHSEEEESIEEDSNFVVDENAHPGFPMVYGNYKACREVSPGVKECLIFETGEHIKENKKSRKRSDSASTSSPAKSESSFPRSPQTKEEEKRVFKIDKSALVESGICIHPAVSVEVSNTSKDPAASGIPDSQRSNLDEVTESPEHDEELASDSQMLSNPEYLSPLPKTAKHPPSYNIDQYSNVRVDLFSRRSGEDYLEDEYIREQENKENIPESRLKKKSRNLPVGRPPVGRVTGHEEGIRYTEPTPGAVSSPPSSGPIPGFNTMQEQQVNWLKMFKVLEDQHRTELREQYSKHSQMIEHMQKTMESELKKQQNNIQQRLEAHRDALTESTHDETSSLSVYGYYTNDPGNIRRSPRRRSPRLNSDLHFSCTRLPHADDFHSDTSDLDPSEIRRSMYTTHDSRGCDIPGQADISEYSTLPDDSFHVKKTLDCEYDSPQTSIIVTESKRSPRSVLERPRSADGSERLLRGGVYSTPMPMSKGRSPQTTYENEGLNDSYNRSVNTSTYRADSRVHGSGDIDPNDESLSYSSKVNLREKHAKHMADLRAYYEEELQALRTALSSSHSNKETPNERILKEDNQDLRRRCEDLTDELDDANSRIRDLEQKIHGLEIRAADYSDRYKDSQVTVLTLKTRLEELHSYAKERDHIIDSLEQKIKHQSLALQDSYKAQDELQEAAKRDKMTLQRTLCKYEDLEKEYRLLKESFISKERSLYDARAEISDLSKTVSRLELKNKQLLRENDNLIHKSAIAMNLSAAKTSYEDSFHVPEPASVPSYIPNHYDKHSTKRQDNLHDTSHYDHLPVHNSPEKETVRNHRVSPLVKAEEELLKLKSNPNISDIDLKTSKKFYGSDNYSACSRDYATGTRVDVKGPTKLAQTDGSPKARATWSKTQPKRSTVKSAAKDHPSPPRFDVSVKEVGNGKDKKKVVQIQEKNRARSPRPVDNSMATSGETDKGVKMNGIDETLEKIRHGDISTRTDSHSYISSTSTSTNTKTESIPIQAMSREDRIKERLKMIQQQEKRYDELTIEKRQLESALNRIPIHGRVGRKSSTEKDELERKLETVEHELGSVRMALRKYQVLKSSR